MGTQATQAIIMNSQPHNFFHIYLAGQVESSNEKDVKNLRQQKL